MPWPVVGSSREGNSETDRRYHVDERLAQVCEAITYDAKDARLSTHRGTRDSTEVTPLSSGSVGDWTRCRHGSRVGRRRHASLVALAGAPQHRPRAELGDRVEPRLLRALPFEDLLCVGAESRAAHRQWRHRRCLQVLQRHVAGTVQAAMVRVRTRTVSKVRSLRLNRRLRACLDLIVSFQTASSAAAWGSDGVSRPAANALLHR
ncbi:hypothetical protein BH11MYX1_BH11MYX1_17530 [soil metagenome]